jgi:SAM-dependent methyltransferase
MLCPLCNEILSKAERRRWPHHRRCPRCGTEALVSTEANAYPEDYFGSTTSKFSGLAGSARRFWHAGRAKRLAALTAAAREPAIYDIGCGDGEFLLACRERGFEVHGCEPVDRPRQQAIQRLGCEIDAAAFQGASSRRYDVITAWQVVEHAANPAALIEEARDHLAPNGILAISTVNLDSFQARAFGPEWLHLDPPRHLWVGSRRAVEKLLLGRQFEVFLGVWNHLEFGPIGYVDSFINLFDSRRDRLLNCLKNGFPRAADKCLWLASAALTPIAMMLSAAETACGAGATFELYSRHTPDVASRLPLRGADVASTTTDPRR